MEGEKSDSSSATTQTATTPSTPTINSNISNNSWGNSNDPNFTWDSVSNATGYSCAFNQTSDTVPSSSASSECDRDITYTDKSDGTYYFHLRACNGSNCSDTVHYTVKIDTTKPNAPDNFSVSNRSSGRAITWDDSSDSTSGINLYRIYRGINCDIAANVKEIPSSEDSTWTDSYKPTEDKTYCYKIRAVDNAGNESDAASKDGIVVEGSGGGGSGSGCNITFTTDPAEYIGTGEAKLKVSSGSKKMYDASENSWIYGVKTIDPRITGTETEKVLTYTIDAQYEGKELKIDYYATDSEDNQCLLQKMLKIDATKPAISVDEIGNNAELKGVAKLSANAEDSGSGISEVNFYYKEGSSWKLIGKAALKDALYSADWNTLAMDNASYSIKAEAKDKAGNLNESILAVILKNQNMQTEFTTTYKSSGLKALLEAANLGDAAVIDEAVQQGKSC